MTNEGLGMTIASLFQLFREFLGREPYLVDDALQEPSSGGLLVISVVGEQPGRALVGALCPIVPRSKIECNEQIGRCPGGDDFELVLNLLSNVV